MDEHRASTDAFCGLEGPCGGVRHQRPAESVRLSRAVDSEAGEQDDAHRMRRHALGVPFGEVSSVDCARRQGLVAEHALAVDQHRGAGGADGRGCPCKPA
jgi:hypothetical protein